MKHTKPERMLLIFYEAMRGQALSVKELSNRYGVSTKSISRYINEIKNFLADNRELMPSVELRYSKYDKSYYLEMDGFLLSRELFSIISVLIGSRSLSKTELLEIIHKLERFTSAKDSKILRKLLKQDVDSYKGVECDCKVITENVWKIANIIDNRKEITIRYYKMNREEIERRIKPISMMFSEYYFYLIAFHEEDGRFIPKHYRIDRIVSIIEHRTQFRIDDRFKISVGELRKKMQFMYAGEELKIEFEYTGPSVQQYLIESHQQN